MKITYNLANAAAKDAANRNMRHNGRTVWNEDDFKMWGNTLNNLLGPIEEANEN